MIFTLHVLSPPELGTACYHAFRFAEALESKGHDLKCVFFQDAGVLTGLSHCESPQDELDVRSRWSALATRTSTALYLCSASAARFGLMPDTPALRIAAGFEITALGDLVAAQRASERVVSFGDPR
ncbi:MAG: DsrE family protein [Pseudomonadota bacterium]